MDISSERLARWSETLSSHHLVLTHLPGKDKIVANALSRHIDENNDEWVGKVFPERQTKETSPRLSLLIRSRTFCVDSPPPANDIDSDAPASVPEVKGKGERGVDLGQRPQNKKDKK